ncbi:MAG: asparagine synthase (glutamine-hydrolyzing) [Nitrospina sp.]|jgi:asparagine synthase (glutamine-hydrolysing)|nr:asparagine synthase (glutamine-hydrolyzing) [Nitrospina sp.]MBT6718628.1 asparagine synthase (glutamine-hydrolyzing) [Nitrospina sp.]
MCGLAGFFSSESFNFDPHDTLLKMGNALEHRGPDDSGIWFDSENGIGLAHQRLSIIDLSKEGHQPMSSANGRFVISYNGEIYNFPEIKTELLKLGFNSWRGRSDTEIILAAIEHWGLRDALTRFRGMFAFALWDKQEKTLHLVRDRMGIKPLYYGWAGSTLIFGSELKAFKAHPKFNREIDREAVALLLRFGYIPAPHSIYCNVSKLPPGKILTLAAKSKEVHEYWSLGEIAERGVQNSFSGSTGDAVAQLETILNEAVRLRMVSDVSIGAFLSGGIDSSVIAALMQKNSDKPVKTFSIGFQESDFDEAPFAKKVASHLGTDHTELYVTSQDALSVVHDLPTIFDEPFADPSQIPTFLLSKLTREKVTVSLSGDGGDELFCGYNRYFVWKNIWNKIRRLPYPIRKSISEIIPLIPGFALDAAASLIGKNNNPGSREKFIRLASCLKSYGPEGLYLQGISHWMGPESIVENCKEPETLLTDFSRWGNFKNPESKMMFVDSLTYLPDDILTKVDRSSMSVGLEARVPLLDHKLVEFAWSLPFNMKSFENQSKWLLKQLLYKYVPNNLVDRPKTGFGVPIHSWLRGPLRDWAEELLNESAMRKEGFMNASVISRKWKEHLSGKWNWQYLLWNALTFQSWLRRQ